MLGYISRISHVHSIDRSTPAVRIPVATDEADRPSDPRGGAHGPTSMVAQPIGEVPALAPWTAPNRVRIRPGGNRPPASGASLAERMDTGMVSMIRIER